MRRKILEILEKNSRVTPGEIAILLGIEVKQVEQEIAQAEQDKIILKYHTLVNWEKAGNNDVLALIDVKVTPQRDVGFDEVARRIYRFGEVRSVMLMSGAYDLSVVIEGKSMKEVALFVAQKLATLEHVQSTMTHFVLKKYKQDGVIFEDEEADRRQVVSP
ncbi:MAG: Lrp/AsnC family transcriptional regulator [Bacillota bacterium]